MNDSLTTGIIAAVSGGLVGALAAVATLWVTGAREKTALSLRFIQEFLGKTQERAAVIHILENPKLADGNDDRANDNLNKIIHLGNWYNVMGLCYFHGHLNRKLILDAGIRDDAHDLLTNVQKSFPSLISTEDEWIYIKRMCNMHRFG